MPLGIKESDTCSFNDSKNMQCYDEGHERIMLGLPRTFTRILIPADRSEIPRPDVIGKMAHLKEVIAEIAPYMENIEVGPLIGLNCPSALRPREVAILSLLGRYINGLIYTSQQRGSITCNRIHLNQEDTFAAPQEYFVPQRMVKEQIIPHAV